MRFTALLLMAGIVSGCAGPRYYGNGRYIASDYDHPTSPTDQFNEYDEHILIQTALKQFAGCADKAHILMLAKFDNQTSDMIDTVALQRQITDILSEDGYSVIDKSSRPDLHNEYVYSQAGYVDPAKAPRMGKQEGVNFLLRAALVSKV